MGLANPATPAVTEVDAVEDLDGQELLRGIVRQLKLVNHHLQLLTGSALEADDMKE